MIETNRIDISKPIDLVTLINTDLFRMNPHTHHGVNLVDDGADIFSEKVNIEVQYASEQTIAAIEKNGGTITTAYYDLQSIQAMLNTEKFFVRGVPIPRRMIPREDLVEYFTNAENRGYLADPEKVSDHRLVLAQKYGYELPKIEEDEDYEMLSARKDPRQIFFGLHPGWIVNLRDKTILKPKEKEILEFYAS